MIKKCTYKIVLTALTLLYFASSSFAQYSSEDDLKTAANNMFEAENYVDALPLFSQLLSLYPKDPSYNYKYGACVLFGSRDKEKALKYLKFAVSKSNVNPIAFYFLAKAYHHNYQFAPAIVNYNKYKGKTSSKEHQKYIIDQEIKMCKNGEHLLKSMTDIGVLSKKEIRATDFFRTYDLKGIGGKIIVKPDEFKTKLDKKNSENSIIYLGEAKNMVVFSSYGSNGSKGKDIFKVVKLPNGEWSKPSNFGDEINTKFDEDYPFLHPDGRTLYFSSKGYNSMGGYDIFKSTLNLSTGKWSFPENLDFPINTPDDDILYISDIDNQLAYFASSRASKQGELTVYRVKVDPEPTENSVIKGIFFSETNPSLKSATITVKDAENDRKYGEYKTQDSNGEYLLIFPSNGGKFKLLVETTKDAPIHSAIIELPILDGFRALKQELRLVGEGDEQKLVVKNLFDESDEFDINDPLVVQNILKQKAKLDVNTTESEVLSSLQSNSDNDEIIPNYSKLSDNQLVSESNQKSTKIINQTKKSKEQANYSYQLANEKTNKAKKLYAQSEKLLEEVDQAESVSERIEKSAFAKRRKNEAAKLVNEAIAALNIARVLDSEVTERESDIENVKDLNEKISNNITNGNRVDAEKNMAQLDEIAAATYQSESALDNEEEITNEKLKEKEDNYNSARNSVIELTNREIELAETIDNLLAKKEAAKKKNEKANIDEQIRALTIDIEDTKFDLKNEKGKEFETKKEYDDFKNQAETSKLILANVNNGNYSGTTVSESSKLQLENNLNYFEKEGLVGLYPEDENLTASNTLSKETYNLEDHKDEYKIIDDSGKIIDYNTQYSGALTAIDDVSEPTQKAALLTKINQEWVISIDEEIDIRNNQLKVETNQADKTDLEDKIASLQILKAEKQKENDENQLVAENNSSTINISEANNITNDEVNITETDGSISNYNEKYTEELDALTEAEDTYDTYTKKAEIHKNWANATEQELLIKKMELSEANEEEKNGIENKISVLESNLTEQQEFSALYAAQAEDVKKNQPIDERANNTADNNNTISEKEVTNESTNNNTTINEVVVENTTTNEANTKQIDLSQFDNNVVNSDGTVADYSTDYERKIEQSNSTDDEYTKNINKANLTKEWISAIDEEIKYRNEELKLIEEDARKEDVTAQITTLETQKNEKQTDYNQYQIAAQKEKSKQEDANLTVNNLNSPEDDFSNIKYNNSFKYESSQASKSVESIVELKNEARNLKDESDVLLNTAGHTSSQSEKEKLIADADALTDKSNRKQEEIARIYESANLNEYYSNQAVLSKLKSSNPDPYSNETIMIELYVEESDNYFEEAKQKREDVINAPNFTAKEVALQKAYELEMKAIEKQKKAINQLSDGSTKELYANVENENNSTSNLRINNEEVVNNNEETATNNEVLTNYSEQPTASSPEITSEDQEILLTLEPTQIIEIKNSEDYKEYAELKKENRRLIKEAEIEYLRSKKFQREADDQKQLGVSLKAMADGAATEEDKAKKLGQIEKLKKMIAGNEAKSSEFKQVSVEKENKAKEANDKSDLILINAEEKDAKSYAVIEKTETFDSNFMTEVMNRTGVPTIDNEVVVVNNEEEVVNNEEEVVNNEETVINNEEVVVNNEETIINNEEEVVNNEEVVTNNEQPINIDEIPTVLSKSIFVINNNQAAYNENKRIPVSPKLPEGLVFKVQIGAFRNPIPQNHFKGFAPIMAEDAGNGITRYTAGLFKTFNMANEAKSSIRSIGYSDAFVVAFLNGKRININEARRMLDGSIADEGNFTINQPDNVETLKTNNTTTPAKINETEEVNDGVSTDVRNIDGIFFAVQVGVYSKPVTAGQLNNVSPLNSERTTSGLIRYTSGVYKTLNDANTAKDRIRNLGISDAFVVAYNGGTKITVSQANQMLSGVNTNNNKVEENTVEENTVEENTVENTPKNDKPGYEPKEDLNLEFKVKLGEYVEDVPVEDAGLFLKLTGRGVKNYEDGDKTVYTIGSFPDYESALDLQIEMKEMGVKNPETIVFRDGVEMSLEDALVLMKNNQ